MTRPLYILPFVFLACLSGAVVVVRAHRAAPSVVVAHAPANAREAWAVGLLGRLGNAQPDARTVALVVAWTVAEDGRDGPGTAMGRNNPINTTQTGFGETETINGDGVKGYPDYESGMAATVQTLSYGYYTEIVAGLQTNDPERALRGMYASPWGTDMRNVESLWRAPAVAPQNGAQRATGTCPVSPCWQSGTGYSPAHPGIDLGATLGQPVYATMGGVAALSTTWPCGNGVMVTDGDTQTLMCHLSGFAVSDGATVQAGDVVGYAGESGEAFGVHVHMEIRINGANVDPSEVLR